MPSKIDLFRLIHSELSRAKAKNLIPYKFLKANFLNTISKQPPSFNFSHNVHFTYLRLPSIFFHSLFFFAIFPTPRKCFLSFSFRAFLNCKVASQSAKFKMKSQLLSAEEELLMLISNTALIFIANTLFVPQLL